MKLSKSEEELMQHLWSLGKGFLKDIIGEYPDPKPAPTTIATLLKRMKDKGFVDYTGTEKTREYFPLVAKSTYFSSHFRGLIKNFFGDSAGTFASFFTQATDLSTDELKALRHVIDQELEKKKK